MATIFDGRHFAAEKETTLALRVLGLKTRGVYPKLASIIIGDDPASVLYVNLKKKAAERIGAEVDIYLIKKNSKLEDLIILINSLNMDKTVHGIMIQLPIPGPLGNFKSKILNSIKPEKDVDGLQEDSQFLHPTSKAVVQIIDEAKKQLRIENLKLKICVIGANGMVGMPLVKKLKSDGYEVVACDLETKNLKDEALKCDIIVSTTGKMNLVTGGMIKAGGIAIDVGSPFGDIEFESVSKKAGFITPVPGGVGPITITCLLENLISAC